MSNPNVSNDSKVLQLLQKIQNSVGLFLIETSCETEVLPETGLPSSKPEQLSLARTCAMNTGLSQVFQ